MWLGLLVLLWAFTQAQPSQPDGSLHLANEAIKAVRRQAPISQNLVINSFHLTFECRLLKAVSSTNLCFLLQPLLSRMLR
jgi:hypothetical protein